MSDVISACDFNDKDFSLTTVAVEVLLQMYLYVLFIDFSYFCVGFVVVLPGKPMCIGCLSLGACLLVENYSMKTMESSCSHVRNITCQTSAMTHTREAFAFQGKV